MLGRQAEIVSPATLQRMLAYAQRTRQPKRDAAIVLLSVKAGLRACEIAGIQWPMATTDKGEIGDMIDIRNAIAKRGSGRRIPMHPDLQGLWPSLVRTNVRQPYRRRQIEAARCAPTASSTGSSRCSPTSASKAARPILDAGRSSPPPPRTCIAPGERASRGVPGRDRGNHCGSRIRTAPSHVAHAAGPEWASVGLTRRSK